MRVALQSALSDANVDAAQASSQRQLSISVCAIADELGSRTAPLNLCLILDSSGSMSGRPLETVKQAAHQIVESLAPGDRISVVVFDHKAKVLIPNQTIDDPASIKAAIAQLRSGGGTCIDEGMHLGIEEMAKGKHNTISQAFLLTDGENEHGDNDRCLKMAELAMEHSMTLSTLGFGDHWNQDVLEQIADAAGGTLAYIQRPDDAITEFNKLFTRVQSVALTNAYLLLTLSSAVRLAELKPIAQVSPETIELPVQQEANFYSVRLGDLMVDASRVVLANLYISHLPEGMHDIAQLQVRYDDPAQHQTRLLSDTLAVRVQSVRQFQPMPDAQVQQHVLALAKYRQTQIAEQKLKVGDRVGAATMLQSAAKTALQMGDQGAATVLQENATRLQTGEDLSEADRKKTRIVSKTTLQPE